MASRNRRRPATKRVWLIQFGEFMLAFAEIEFSIYCLLTKASGLSWAGSAAILSGTRVDQAISQFRRLVEARRNPVATISGPEKPNTFPNYEAMKDFDECFSHLSTISRARNSIVHYGAAMSDTEGTFVTTNRNRMLTAVREQAFIVSPSDLHAMTVDLRKIMSLFLYHMALHESAIIKSQYEHRYHGITKPWRYITRQPTNNNLRSQDPPPKQQRPPRS